MPGPSWTEYFWMLNTSPVCASLAITPFFIHGRAGAVSFKIPEEKKCLRASPHYFCPHLSYSCLPGGLTERMNSALLRSMTNAEVLDIFRQTGALLEGHFILRSGLHSRQYFQCALALQQMPIVERLGAALADQVRHLAPSTVISPAMGGLVIGQEVARQLGVRFIFAEKEDSKLALRRGFKITAGDGGCLRSARSTNQSSIRIMLFIHSKLEV